MLTSAAADRQGVVVVVGAINVDLILRAETLPGPGETVVGTRVQSYGGGKGANAAVAAARAGAKVYLIGAVGNDAQGAEALEHLRDEGVVTEHVQVLDGESTGIALIVVDSRAENQIAVGAGANAAISLIHVGQALEELLPDADIVLVSSEITPAAVTTAALTALAADVRCVLNPAPVIDEITDLIGSDLIMTPNRSEAQTLTERIRRTTRRDSSSGHTPGDCAGIITSHTGGPVVITEGAEGVLLSDAGAVHRVPALAVDVMDSTGAGDTFNGVLAARLAAGESLWDAVDTAVVAASLSVGQPGARSAMPDWNDIQSAMMRRGATLPVVSRRP